MAEPAAGVRGHPRAHPVHHQLHHAPARQLRRPGVHHLGGGLPRRAPHRRRARLFPGDRKGAGAGRLRAGHPAARPERRLHGDHRFCPHRRAAARGRDRAGGAGRQAAALLSGGRLRRHPAQPPLLHRVCPPDPARHHPADPGLRQVPPERPAPWHRAGHRPAPHPGRGPVQRRLQRHPHRIGAGRRLWLRRQRPAPLAGAVLV